MEVTAVIVARKGSVRIKNKSMSVVGGETLIARKIRQLKDCKNVSRIVVGSNCEEMLDHAARLDAEVVMRPDYFCDETKASANEMIGNMASLIKTDVVMWSHCTNPLLSPATYDRAIDAFAANEARHDSLLSVVKVKEHFWGEDKKPLNYNPYGGRHVPARELPAYYMQDGGIFIQPHAQMLRNSYFFGATPFLFEIPDEEFLDINNERDLILAQALI